MKSRLTYSILLAFLVACSSKVEKGAAEAKESAVESNIVSLTKTQLHIGKIAIGSLRTTKMQKTIKVNGFIDVPPQNILSVSSTWIELFCLSWLRSSNNTKSCCHFL